MFSMEKRVERKLGDAERVRILTYALGFAIGALEAVNLSPYDFNKDGVVNILRKLKDLSGAPIFYANFDSENMEQSNEQDP